MRLTSEELSSAIIDSLSSFVQASMDKTSIDLTKNNYIAGQYIQLAFLLQVVLNIPLLVFWVFFMENFVMWLVKDPTIAIIAFHYASIVVFAYIVQALSRTLTVVFHICGHEHFESIIDLVAAALQVIAIACVVTLVDEADLSTVACIQGAFVDMCIDLLISIKPQRLTCSFHFSVDQRCICNSQDCISSSQRVDEAVPQRSYSKCSFVEL